MFFSEEKNQKTFAPAPAAPNRLGKSPAATANRQKSFGSFLQKRTLLSLPLPHAPPNPSASAILAGPLPLTLPDALSASGITPTPEPTAPILITTGPEAATTARDFAHAVRPGQDALIVTLLADTPPDHAAAAQHWAFTRQAALDWAPRRIRVNAIALGADPMIPARPAAALNCNPVRRHCRHHPPHVAPAEHDRPTCPPRSAMNAPRLPEPHGPETRIASAQRALRHVFLRDMVLHAAVGVHAFERTGAQRIRINIDLAVEDPAAPTLSRPAHGRDELSRVVDYEVVADRVRAIVAAGHVSLLETLAERLAEACLTDPRVRLARIRVEKLDIFPDAASVGVEIERRNTASPTVIPDPP